MAQKKSLFLTYLHVQIIKSENVIIYATFFQLEY